MKHRYLAQVDDKLLCYGILKSYGTEYATPIAAERALRRFAGKTKKQHTYRILKSDGSVFATINPAAIPTGICVKVVVRCDGLFKATGGGLSAVSRKPNVACNKVINAWLKEKRA